MTHSDLSKPPADVEPVRISRMAQWAAHLGIIGAITGCIGVGAVLGLFAIILGVISRHAIETNPEKLGGLGYANAGIRWGLISWVVLILTVILWPSTPDRRKVSNRSACAANVTGTVKGFVVYANENNNCFPTPGLPPADKAYSTALGTMSTTTDPDTAVAQLQKTSGAQGNPMSALWILVLRQQETPKSLICKSDAASSGTPSPTVDSAGRYFLNPEKAGQISYSIAYPYASATKVGDWWKNTTQPDLPVISDMAPLNGTGRPKRNLAATGTPKDLKTVNSGNHNGDGQNVGFADAHCEWRTNPLAGQGGDNKGGDNIWTIGTAGPPEEKYGGNVITGGEVPNYPPTATPPFDTIMVPVRDLGSGAIR